MIRFSAVLVAVAIGLLVGGMATSKLLLVYIAIVVSAVALITLVVGVLLKRHEFFGDRQGLVPAGAGAGPVAPAAFSGSRGAGRSRDKLWPDAVVPPPVTQDNPVQGNEAAAGFGTAPGESAPVAATRAEPVAPAPSWGTPPARDPWSSPAADALPPWSPPGQDEPAGELTRFDWLSKSADPVTPGPVPPDATTSDVAAGDVAAADFTSSSTTPDSVAAVDDDDDWPTRYSWLDEEPDEPAEPLAGEPTVQQAVVEPAAVETPAVTSPTAKPAVAEPATVASAAVELAPAEPAVVEPPTAASAAVEPAAAPAAVVPPDAEPPAVEPATIGQAPAESGTGQASDTATSGGEPGEPLPVDGAAEDPAAISPSAASTSPADADAVSADALGAEAEAGDAEISPAEADWSEPAADVEPSPADADAADPVRPDPESRTALVAVVRGVPRYHEPDCVLIRFMPPGDVQRLTIPEASATGCTPCAVCQTED